MAGALASGVAAADRLRLRQADDQRAAVDSKENSDKSCNANDKNPKTNHPVIIATGEKVLDQDDARGFGMYALNYTRTYRSQKSGGGTSSSGWTSSIDPIQIQPSASTVCLDVGCIPANANFVFPGGSTYQYVYDPADPGTYTVKGSALMGRASYSPVSKVWSLTKGKLSHLFNSSRRLTEIRNQDGYSLLKYSYQSGQTLIQNSSGQSIKIIPVVNGYTVTDQANQTWTYQTNASGMLTSVTAPNGAQRTYHYEDPADPKLLTGMSVNGARYSRYAYYTDKRVRESGLDNGEEKQSFTYTPTQTTVTNAAGHATTYTFASGDFGSRRLTGTSRAATQTCGATAKQTVYDASGYIDYTLDWNNVKTDYSYSSLGLLTQKTTAPGTAQAITSVNVWADNGDDWDLIETTLRNSANVAYVRSNYTYYIGGRIASETVTDLRTGVQRTTTHSYTLHANRALASHTTRVSLPGGAWATSVRNYDILGNLTSATNPADHEVRYSGHNALGLPGRMTDPNGIATDYTYDARGNLLTATQQLPTGARTATTTYNGANQPLDMVSPTGTAARLRYNSALRLTQVGNALNEYVDMASCCQEAARIPLQPQ